MYSVFYTTVSKLIFLVTSHIMVGTHICLTKNAANAIDANTAIIYSPCLNWQTLTRLPGGYYLVFKNIPCFLGLIYVCAAKPAPITRWSHVFLSIKVYTSQNKRPYFYRAIAYTALTQSGDILLSFVDCIFSFYNNHLHR